MLHWETPSFFFICEMKYDAIIFDLGGVLINVDYHKTIRAFQQLGIVDFSSLYSQAGQIDIFSQFETGEISSQRFINELLAFLPSGTTPNQVVHAWNQMIQNVPLESILLLEQLKEKYPLFMLSNTNDIHVPLVRKEWAKITMHPMEYYFNKIYFSHEFGMRKPSPETFIKVCERESLRPQTTLFIDDSIQHIQGAQSAGLLTHHLTEINSLYEFFS